MLEEYTSTFVDQKDQTTMVMIILILSFLESLQCQVEEDARLCSSSVCLPPNYNKMDKPQ